MNEGDEPSRRVLDVDPQLNRMLHDTVHGGLFYQNHVTGEHLWSDALFELLGLPEDFEISAETFVQRLHPDDFAPVLESAGRAQQDPSCTSYVIDFRFRHTDGEYRRMRSHCQLERNEQGLVVVERGVLLDISERWEL